MSILDKQTVNNEKDKFAIIIPLRGIQTAKQRLRKLIDSDKVNKIVEYLLKNTLRQIKHSQLETSPVYILSGDKNFKTENGHFFKDQTIYPNNMETIYDEGTSLNLAISDFCNETDYSRLMLIMPDLPGITSEDLDRFFQLSKLFPNVISSTYDQGTAIALLKKEFFEQGFFGEKSSEKIIQYANENNIQLSKLILQKLTMDLDSETEWNYWQETIDILIE